MRLSTKGRYALEALVLMGYLNIKNKTMSLKRISLEANISEGYLEQLFSMLKKESIVASKKGKNGGYRFVKPMDEIMVGDILRAVEGSLSPVKCLDNEFCNRKQKCITRSTWQVAYDKINMIVDNISLKKVVDNYYARINAGSSI